MSTSIFIGLVTHESSRFPEARGSHGLTNLLQKELTKQLIPVSVEIHSRNHFSELELDLSMTDLRESIRAEHSVERDWYHFLKPEGNHAVSDLILEIRSWIRFLRETTGKSAGLFTELGVPKLERLINIELAHLHLMQRAITSQADWVLILEDDAHVENTDSFGSSLRDFVIQHQAGDVPQYVNLSRSFSTAKLRIESLVTPLGRWDAERELLGSSLPVTNTVCAVLYRRAFVIELLESLRGIPLTPVIPIDWKINLALMKLHSDNRIPDGGCWLVEPAPIIQGSMHG